MPAPIRQSADSRFVALQQVSRSLGENNDCTVKAIAATTGLQYGVVHAQLQHHGRKSGRGAHLHIMDAALRSLGFKKERVAPSQFINQYPKSHQILKSVTTHHADRFNSVWADGNNYILFTSSYRHAVGIVNGTNVDWTRGRAQRIVEIWKITRA